MSKAKSKRQAEVEATLPEELRPVFTQLVEDYRASATTRVPGYSGGVPSFEICADLVRLGWRRAN